MNIFLKDKKGEPSATLTMFVIGCNIVFLKLLLSGVEINDHFKVSNFTGVEFAAAIAALGGIYALRKNNKKES